MLRECLDLFFQIIPSLPLSLIMMSVVARDVVKEISDGGGGKDAILQIIFPFFFHKLIAAYRNHLQIQKKPFIPPL